MLLTLPTPGQPCLPAPRYAGDPRFYGVSPRIVIGHFSRPQLPGCGERACPRHVRRAGKTGHDPHAGHTDTAAAGRVDSGEKTFLGFARTAVRASHVMLEDNDGDGDRRKRPVERAVGPAPVPPTSCPLPILPCGSNPAFPEFGTMRPTNPAGPPPVRQAAGTWNWVTTGVRMKTRRPQLTFRQEGLAPWRPQHQKAERPGFP